MDFELILNSEYIQDMTWKQFLDSSAELKGIKNHSILPVFVFNNFLEEPQFIGFCVMNENLVLFVDYEISKEVKTYVETLNEFIDTTFWNTHTECLLYHGVAIVADAKVQECAQEFGWYEAYMASYRGNYENYQELATEPNL
jgi:hypothetical protein